MRVRPPTPRPVLLVAVLMLAACPCVAAESVSADSAAASPESTAIGSPDSTGRPSRGASLGDNVVRGVATLALAEGMAALLCAPSYLHSGAGWMAAGHGFNALSVGLTLENETTAAQAVGFFGFLGLMGYNIYLHNHEPSKSRVFWQNMLGYHVVFAAITIGNAVGVRQERAKQLAHAAAYRIHLTHFQLDRPPVDRWQPNNYIVRHEAGTVAFISRFRAAGQAITLHVREARADTAVRSVGELLEWTRRSLESLRPDTPRGLEVHADAINGTPCARASYSGSVRGRKLWVREVRFLHPLAPEHVLEVQWRWIAADGAPPAELPESDTAFLASVVDLNP